MNYDPKLIGDRIKYYRNKQNLSQKELSVRCGISQSYITELENGKSKYKQLNTLLKLADYFNITLDDLFFDNLEKYREITADEDEQITTMLRELSVMSVPRLKCIFNIADDFYRLRK